MKKPVILITLLLLSIFGFGQNNKPYVIRYQSQGDIIQHNTQSVSGIHIDSLGQTLTHDNGVEWSSLDDLDTVYIYRGYYRIQQSDLQNWDFGIVSHNNNVVLVKEEDDDDDSSHVLILMHQTEDTLSFTYQNDTLTDFYYNSYHFMVSEIDTLFLFTTIDGNTAVSYAIPSCEHIAKFNSKGRVSTLIDFTKQIIEGIFHAESGINMLVDIESGDRESLIHDLGEMSIEVLLGFIHGGPGVVFSHELWKHYINHLHNKALQFHLGNASCTIQSIQQNESTNMIDVTVSVINGEDIPDNYRWKPYYGQHVWSENSVYYGVLCRAGNNFPTIQKFDYDKREELLRPHASITHTFSFPVMAVEKILFRPYLYINYDYHDTALYTSHLYNTVGLARYGAVEAFYPEFEINTIANPTEGGTVTEGGRYHFNTQITLTATAISGYEFSHWEDGSESNPRVITVEGDATYTAYFNDPLFDINIIASPTEGGTVGGSGRYPANTTIITTATANSGYEFTHWEDGSELNPRTITVEGDATYTAYFEEQQPSLPDLSGTWTFNQTYFSENHLQLNMQFQSSTATRATYHSSWGVNSISLTVYIDGSMSIGCYSPYGYTGSFSGSFNTSFTVASGDSYYYGTGSWANPGWIVENPWTFTR